MKTLLETIRLFDGLIQHTYNGKILFLQLFHSTKIPIKLGMKVTKKRTVFMRYIPVGDQK